MSKRITTFTVTSNSQAFGQSLPVGQVILNLGNNSLLRLTAPASSTDTLATATSVAIGGGGGGLTNLEDSGANVQNSASGTGFFQWENTRINDSTISSLNTQNLVLTSDSGGISLGSSVVDLGVATTTGTLRRFQATGTATAIGIELIPKGNGNILLGSQSVTLGITSTAGTNRGFLAEGSQPNIDISFTPKGTGDIILDPGSNEVRVAGSGTGTATQAFVSFYQNDFTTRHGLVGIANGSSDDLFIQADRLNASIILRSGSEDLGTFDGSANGNITLNPRGTGNVILGNYTLDGDQTVGAGQDNHVLTYDNGTGLISLEAPTGGSNVAFFTVAGNTTVAAGALIPYVTAHNGITGLTNTSGTFSIPPGEYLIEHVHKIFQASSSFELRENTTQVAVTGTINSNTTNPSTAEGRITIYRNYNSTTTVDFMSLTFIDVILRTDTGSSVAIPTNGATLKITKLS